MDIEGTKWRFKDANGVPRAPEYSLANYAYAVGKTCNHYRDDDILKSSAESIVEDLVKSWEMERSHKVDPSQHMSVNQEKFTICANKGKVFDNLEANRVGNYNALL